MPVPVGVGSSVAGGTMNTTGSFIMRAERVGADTALSRIIKLVREAQSSKAPIARLADDVSLIFVPTVMALAVIAGAGWLYWGHVPVSEAFRISWPCWWWPARARSALPRPFPLWWPRAGARRWACSSRTGTALELAGPSGCARVRQDRDVDRRQAPPACRRNPSIRCSMRSAS